MDITETLKQIPQSPGIYQMFDSRGNIIYVGKAKNLKNRVLQYFTNNKDRAPKVEEMIRNIYSIKYVVTDTELDAFLDECRLIKEIKPRYNRQLKNTAKYLFIKIPAEPFPKVKIAKEKEADDALYFGPFTSRRQVETTIQYLNEFYPIRKCASPRVVKRSNGCLYLQLGKCLGVCTAQIRPDEYQNHIEKIRQLLNGADQAAFQELPKLIDSAVDNLNFEHAAQYREYYLGLRHILGKQQLVRSSNKQKNILAVEFIDHTHAKIFFIKGNKLLYREILDTIEKNTTELSQHLKQLIRGKFTTEKTSDKSGLTQHDLDEAQIIYSYLKNNKKKILSYWIPDTRLKEPGLDGAVSKIVERITSANFSV